MTRTVDRLCSLQYAAAYETLRVFSIYKWLDLIGPNNWDIFVVGIPLRRSSRGFFQPCELSLCTPRSRCCQADARNSNRINHVVDRNAEGFLL